MNSPALPPSPFAQAHESLSALGFHVLPLIAFDAPHGGRGKAPGSYRGGWQGTTKWQRFRDETLSGFDLKLALTAPNANIGIVCGSQVAPDQHIVVLDFDAADPDALDALLSVAPASPMVKRGQKGESRFYLAPKTMKTRSYDGPDGRLLDLLTGFDTRQTVVPPSIHPDTRQPYVWTRGPVAASELPTLTEDDLQALEEALEMCGWVRGGRAATSRAPKAAPVDADDMWSEVKAAAMANLQAWVPALDLYDCRPARGGFEAVATWRASSSGRPIAERKRNLSIQANGIKDFGTNETYSSIDLVMAARDCDQPEATDWLRERLGLKDDGVVIALGAREPVIDADLPEPLRRKGGGVSAPVVAMSKTNAAILPAPAHEPLPATPVSPGELPEHLLKVPGLVGDLCDWMARTAVRPLPIINLGAALCVVGTVAARKWATPTEGGTHLYILALAGTGQGKDHPRRAATHLLASAGLKRFLAPSSWKSDSALVQHVSRHPACVSFSDEVGEFIGRLNSKSASTHERGVSGVMRELWGVNWGMHTPPGWADSRDRQRIEPISAPAYSFLGLSVPEAVWEALAGADLSNGFANRFLVLASDREVAEQDPDESVFDVSDALLDRLRMLADFGGHLTNITMHVDETSAPLVRVPWEGGRGGAAHQAFKDLQEFCRTQPESETLMKRTAEIAVRIATIRAIGVAGPDATVTVADIEWGRDLAVWSARRMIADTAAYMSESEWQAKAKFVLRCISSAPGRQITRTALCRKVAHRFPARDLDAIIKGLQESAEVTDNSSRAGRRGPEALTYVAL